MATLDNPKGLITAAIALVGAVVLVEVVGSNSPASRLTDLDVGGSDVPSIYIQLDPRVPGRCYITDRQGSTMRRSDDPGARRPWEFARAGPEGPWVLRSKRQPTFLLVSAFDVPDWTFPYVYRFTRDLEDAEDLPSVEWVRTYENRIYSGLFLKLELPAERRGSGSLQPELLIVSGSQVGCTDVRFSEGCRIYPDLIALGRLPRMTPPSDLVTWLLSRSPVDERLLIVAPEEPFSASLVPLPVSLLEVYRRIVGRDVHLATDDRVLNWAGRDQETSLSSHLRAELDAGWPAYRARLESALRVHCEFHQCLDELDRMLPERMMPDWTGPSSAARRTSR